ncbi:MAG TPA: MFS transporter [Micromonosporaceae bacterium]
METRDADRLAPSAARASRMAMVGVSVAMFCIQVDFFALNLAIPDMARDLDATTDSVQWVISGYMLAVASLFILCGRLGDIYGRRLVLLAGVAIFAASSALCAIAPNLATLIAFRVLSGAGAAIIFPVGIAVISNAFDDARRAWALGLVFGIANIGTAIGPFLGGGLSQGPGWRWIFWVLVLLSAIAFIIVLLGIRDSRDPTASRRLDSAGAVLLIAGVATLSYAVDRGDDWGWGSWRTIGMFVLSAVLLVAFFLRETRARNPLIDLSLFHNLPYVLVMSVGAIANVGFTVVIFVVTLYLQNVRGLSPLIAGVVFVAPAAMVAFAGPIGARIKPYFRPTAIMAGAAVLGAAATLGATYATSWFAFIPLLALAGFGFGLGWTFANVATQDVVHPDRAGEASGVLLTVLVSAGGFGLAAAATAVSSLQQGGTTANDAYLGTLRVLSLVVFVWAAAVLAIRAVLVRRGLMAPLNMSASLGATERAVSSRSTAPRG